VVGHGYGLCRCFLGKYRGGGDIVRRKKNLLPLSAVHPGEKTMYSAVKTTPF